IAHLAQSPGVGDGTRGEVDAHMLDIAAGRGHASALVGTAVSNDVGPIDLDRQSSGDDGVGGLVHTLAPEPVVGPDDVQAGGQVVGAVGASAALLLIGHLLDLVQSHVQGGAVAEIDAEQAAGSGGEGAGQGGAAGGGHGAA